MANQLTSEQQLDVNGALLSTNERVQLIMQGDGNLVLYRTDNHVPLWSSNTWQKPVQRARMQADGNFVCYDAGTRAFWSSGTWGHDGAYVILQDDGNLVLYQNGVQPNPNGTGALWASGTVQNWGQPSLPGSVDSGDVHVGTGNWMRSKASINANGLIDGTTRTWCKVALRGFTGSCCPILFNQQGVAIWPNNPEQARHQYGVDGEDIPFGQSDRTEHWENRVDAGVLAQTSRMGLLHWYDPKMRLLPDLQIASRTIQQIIEAGYTVYNLAVLIAA